MNFTLKVPAAVGTNAAPPSGAPRGMMMRTSVVVATLPLPLHLSQGQCAPVGPGTYPLPWQSEQVVSDARLAMTVLPAYTSSSERTSGTSCCPSGALAEVVCGCPLHRLLVSTAATSTTAPRILCSPAPAPRVAPATLRRAIRPTVHRTFAVSPAGHPASSLAAEGLH